VAGYLGNIQNMYLLFLTEGGKVDAAHDVLLPDTLETLSEGVHYVDRIDAKQWRKIGKAAEAFKDRLDAGKSVSWKEVHAALLLDDDDVFICSCRNKTYNSVFNPCVRTSSLDTFGR
jgi:hypothetical protein